MTERRKKLDKGTSMPLLDRVLENPPAFLKDVEFRAVRNLHELTVACHLVYEEYVKAKYIMPNADFWKVSAFQTLPTTVTFIAIHKSGEILGTVSIIEDSPLGLPMDHVYKPELDVLRLDGHHPAEFTMVALNKKLFEKGKAKLPMSSRLIILMNLFRVTLHYLYSCTNVDEIVGSFIPEHDVLYRFLQMKSMSQDARFHPSVRGTVGVARHLNIPETIHWAKDHKAYGFFFGQQPDADRHAARLKYLYSELKALFVDHSNILASLAPHELVHVKAAYPLYDLDALIRSKSLFDYLVENLENKTLLPPDSDKTEE